MSQKPKGGIYLGKQGKVYGPISAAQFTQIQTTGELAKYSWWWDPDAGSWQPTEPPPPAPNQAKVETALVGLLAICHDFRQAMVAGILENIDESGCHLRSRDHRELPCFVLNSELTLNLVDPNTGHAVNVKALLRDAWRQGKGWIYRLTWEKPPMLQGA